MGCCSHSSGGAWQRARLSRSGAGVGIVRCLARRQSLFPQDAGSREAQGQAVREVLGARAGRGSAADPTWSSSYRYVYIYIIVTPPSVSLSLSPLWLR